MITRTAIFTDVSCRIRRLIPPLALTKLALIRDTRTDQLRVIDRMNILFLDIIVGQFVYLREQIYLSDLLGFVILCTHRSGGQCILFIVFILRNRDSKVDIQF